MSSWLPERVELGRMEREPGPVRWMPRYYLTLRGVPWGWVGTVTEGQLVAEREFGERVRWRRVTDGVYVAWSH